MGRSVIVPGDAIEALFRRIVNLERKTSRRPSISLRVVSSGPYIPSDGDGDVWINADDNTIHFQINGNEFSIQGTAV